MIFFSSLGFWFFSDGINRTARLPAFAAGLAFGLSFLAKQPGLLDFGVCLVIVLLSTVFERERAAKRLLPWLVLGFVLPLAATATYFARHGAFADLIFYSWTYNTQYYVTEVPLMERLAAVRVPLMLLTERLPVALILGGAGAVMLLRTAFGQLRRRPAVAVLAWLILGWSATGLLSTMLSGRDFTHYSMQVMPGVSLACGWVLAELAGRSKTLGARGRTGARLLLGGGIALALLSLIVPAISWLTTVDTADGHNRELGQLIQAHTRPSDRIFIWGYMPEMHVYAQRLPSTRYFYTNWVTGLVPWTNLDWLKDTKYAVIPGTPELLRSDFARRPPTMIVDTMSRRGYLKYPLREQAWLWRTIEYEFAEIEPDLMNSWGFKLYQRIADAPYGAAIPKEAAIDSQVVLTSPAETASLTTPVKVSYPAGTEVVELYKDGSLYRRVECPSAQPGTIGFSLVGSDLPLGQRTVQAVVRGRRTLASAPHFLLVTPPVVVIPAGPPLEFEGSSYPPLVAFNRNGAIARLPNGLWNAEAPAKIAYTRPQGLYGIEVEYALDEALARDPERWKTDGVDLVVQFVNQAGNATELYRRHLDARYSVIDQGPQKAVVHLPTADRGEVVIWFSPGKESDASCDWARVQSVRGISAPIGLVFRGQSHSAYRIETGHGMTPFMEQNVDVLMVHAPSVIEFALAPGMYRLSGVLGFLPEAWKGPKGSAGAIFEVWHLPPGGPPKLVYHQLLDPVHNPQNRGIQTFSTILPSPATGAIRLVTRPAHPEDNAFNYTYWGQLVAEEFPARIATPGLPIRFQEIEARFGFSEMDEAGEKVIFAHAPSQIVFPLDGKLTRLQGKFGLIVAAYSGREPTEGARFAVVFEDPSGQRTVLWSREIDPQAVPGDRGFLPFSVTVPAQSGHLILRTDARAGHNYARAWSFWHDLQLEP